MRPALLLLMAAALYGQQPPLELFVRIYPQGHADLGPLNVGPLSGPVAVISTRLADATKYTLRLDFHEGNSTQKYTVNVVMSHTRIMDGYAPAAFAVVQIPYGAVKRVDATVTDPPPQPVQRSVAPVY